MTAWWCSHRSSVTSKRLDAIPGVGPALAIALVTSIADPKTFRSGRLLGLGWAVAKAERKRRQGQAWQYQQTR
ncbi:transposase [Bradyrhizobium sp. 182]|nr:transposase [Bradyrhizobium sp. 182]